MVRLEESDGYDEVAVESSSVAPVEAEGAAL